MIESLDNSNEYSNEENLSDSENLSVSEISSITTSYEMPVARRINDIEAQVFNESNFTDNYSDISDDLSEYYLDTDNKPFLYKYIIFLIWLFYILSLFDGILPNEKNLFYSTITEYPNCKDVRFEIWRMFTMSLVHSDFIHIFLNTIFLFNLLFLTESSQKYQSLLIIIFFASILTSMSFSYFLPYTNSIGCSHLLFAFTGSLLSDLLINFKYLDEYLKNIYILLLILITLAEVISYIFFYNENIAYVSHWTGGIIGFLVSLIIFNDKQTKKRNAYAVFFGSNLLSVATFFLLYNYITNWPPDENTIFTKDKITSCCYQLLVNNVTDVSCHL